MGNETDPEARKQTEADTARAGLSMTSTISPDVFSDDETVSYRSTVIDDNRLPF